MNAHLQSKLYTAMNPNTKSKKSATTEFIATKTNTASTGKDTQTMKTVGSAMTTSTPQTFSDNSTPNIQRQALLQRRGGCNGSCGNSKLRFAEPQQTRSQRNHTLSAPRKLSSRNHRLLAITALFSQSPRSSRNHRSLSRNPLLAPPHSLCNATLVALLSLPFSDLGNQLISKHDFKARISNHVFQTVAASSH